MNWGKSIILAFVLFAGFILYMVFEAFNQDFDLVAEDYYTQEINYQKKIEQKTNLSNLEKQIVVTRVNESVVLTFPKGQQPTGEIHFYHPSLKKYDQRIPIGLDEANAQTVNRDKLIAGGYRINITWESGGKEYFQQESIFIQ